MCAQYVTHGAKIKCSCGSKIANLQVLPDRTVTLTEGHYANISDHQSMVNIPPFGVCRSLKYPPTKSETDAHHGSLTPMPCKPGTMSIWQDGNDSYIIRHFPALLTSSYCRCIYGGVITIVTDGQIPDNYEFSKESSCLKEDTNSDVDDGIGLDVVDFIPVVGSIRDIGDGLATGSAGLVALGVGFLVADVAGLVGSVFSGGAATVGVTAAKSTAKAGIKAAAKASTKAVAKTTAKQGEKKLLELTSREATAGATKLSTEAMEELGKEAMKNAGPNIFQVGTKIAETGAKATEKSKKAIPEIIEKSKDINNLGNEILNVGMKQIDDVAQAGRSYFTHGMNQIKKYLGNNEISNYLNGLSQASRKMEELSKDIDRLNKITKFLK